MTDIKEALFDKEPEKREGSGEKDPDMEPLFGQGSEEPAERRDKAGGGSGSRVTEGRTGNLRKVRNAKYRVSFRCGDSF